MPDPFYYCLFPTPTLKIWGLGAVAQWKRSVCKTENLGCYTSQPANTGTYKPQGQDAHTDLVSFGKASAQMRSSLQ